MKKIIIIFICLALFSCNENQVNNAQLPIEETPINNVDNSANEEDNTEQLPQEEVEDHSGWSLDASISPIKLAYELPNYIPANESYDFDIDQIENLDQFNGFTKGQLQMLEENGFVVIQSLMPPMKMHHTYEYSNYLGDQMFITSDIMMYLYHLLYSGSMKEFELTKYSVDLKTILASLVDQVEKAYLDYPSENMESIYAYLGVANTLMNNDASYPDSVEGLINEELLKIESAAGYEYSKIFDTKLDYSQYIVRGHYTQSDQLSSYFRSMMWLSQWGFQMTSIEDDIEVIDFDNVEKSMLLTYFTLLDSEVFQKYIDIYELTSLYSGASDDLNVIDLKDMMLSVFDEVTLDKIIDESYQVEIAMAIEQLREPSINLKVAYLKVGKQFRLMGQRYTLDADVMQELVEPFLRPLPTALDYLTVQGHEKAEEILYKHYPTNQQWPEFDEKLLEMKTYVSDLDDAFYRGNLYSGWLWGIDAAAQSFNGVEGMPSYMQSDAWDLKNLNSALGSFVELKHDNILYAKQSAAEMGGFFPEDFKHYIEPNVELYSRLLWLAENMKANLQGKVEEESFETIDEVIEIYRLAVELSIKELENTPLTRDEMQDIAVIGGLCDYLDWHYLGLMRQADLTATGSDTSALIVDIATAGHNYNEIANGMPMDIYVITPINDKLFLTSGTVYSYYEFWSEKRITDEEWQGMIGIGINDYGYNTFKDSDWNYLDTMPWMTFVSPEKATIEYQAKEADYD